jgi:DNA-binding PadR family transcriptional regulator
MQVGSVTERATAMRSPVNWSLLGLVIQRASYGYELVQRFERAYGEALELSSPSQIYTALDILARHGLIELLPAEQAELSRQPKPHYRATPAGIEAYGEWLVAHFRREQRRSRLFVHQVSVLPARAALAVIERCEHECLKAATATSTAGKGRQAGDCARLAECLLDEEQRLTIDAHLAWIEYARRQLLADAASTSAPAPARTPASARTPAPASIQAAARTGSPRPAAAQTRGEASVVRTPARAQARANADSGARRRSAA